MAISRPEVSTPSWTSSSAGKGAGLSSSAGSATTSMGRSMPTSSRTRLLSSSRTVTRVITGDDLAYGAAVLSPRERPDAEGVSDRRHAVPVGRPNVPEVLRGLAVVQQPAATEDEDVEPGDLLVDGVTPTPAGVDDPIGQMSAAGVRGVAGEHHDLGEGRGLSQGGEYRGQDRLVADVEPAVGTEQSDGCHPGSPVDVSPVSAGRRDADGSTRTRSRVGGEDRLAAVVLGRVLCCRTRRSRGGMLEGRTSWSVVAEPVSCRRGTGCRPVCPPRPPRGDVL